MLLKTVMITQLAATLTQSYMLKAAAIPITWGKDVA